MRLIIATTVAATLAVTPLLAADNEPAKRLDDAAAVFSELREQGLKVVLDTGFARAVTDAVLERLGWDEPGTVDATVTADVRGAGGDGAGR